LGGYERNCAGIRSNLNIGKGKEDYNVWIEHVNDEQYLKGD